MRHVILSAILLLLCVSVGAPSLDVAEAAGRNLDGRVAPDMQFAAGGLFGVTPQMKLSALRGRPVFIKFWLRDCPICRRTLPRLQQLHDQWGGRGLVVLSVIHKFRGTDVRPLMEQLGYDFPVACDVDGSQARKYGIGRRPADYLIGVDGRVKESNEVSDQAIAQELGKYRLAQVDPLPQGMRAVRDIVWQGRMGTALQQSAELAGQPNATAEVKAAHERVVQLARQYLEGGATWAASLAKRRKVAEARGEYARLKLAFAGTALAARAGELEAAFVRQYGKP